MANEQIIEEILNLNEEVLKIAAAKDHTHNHDDYYTKSQCDNKYLTQTQTDNRYYTKTYCDENYYKNTDCDDKFYTKTYCNDNYYTKTNCDNKFYTKTNFNSFYNDEFENILNGKTFNTPKNDNRALETIINDSNLEAGFYKLTYNGSISNISEPTDIHYKNGILEIRIVDNQKIYYLYTTSQKGNEYKLNGKEFIKYDFENEWRVYKMPTNLRNDLLGTRRDGVISNSFSIYELTTGYIFTWKNGSNSTYTLIEDENNWASLYTFNELPIIGNHIFSNLVGHCDIKVNKNEIFIRSIDKKGEVIQGVDVSFFVPRIN